MSELPLNPTGPLRALVIDEVAKVRARRIMEYAAAHPYSPGPGVEPPGDNPNHVGMFSSYRAVFSYSHGHGAYDNKPATLVPMKFRHLSVSVPGGKYPNPIAVWSLAELFGFTGWDGKSWMPPPDWMSTIGPVEHGPHIVVVQPIPEGPMN